MRKIFTAVLAFTAPLAFAACGEKAAETEDTIVAEETVTEEPAVDATVPADVEDASGATADKTVPAARDAAGEKNDAAEAGAEET